MLCNGCLSFERAAYAAQEERAAAELAAAQAERERFNAVDLKNEQTYRDLAADSASRGFAANAECFTAKADFYGQRAASR